MTNIVRKTLIPDSKKKQNMNLYPVSLFGATGNVNSVPSVLYGQGYDHAIRAASKLIAHFFSPVRALASKPAYTIVPSLIGGKVVINLFYYIANRDQALTNSTVNSLGSALSKLFGLAVELRLVRLHYPYLNSYILAQYVAINTSKYNFTRIQRAIFSALLLPIPQSIAHLGQQGSSSPFLAHRSLPAHIIGMKIRISGRQITQRSVPRQTVQTAQIGSFTSSLGMKNVIDSASFTSKNKKGAFTVKVWISQLPSLLSSA